MNDALIAGLLDARSVELELLEGLSDSQMLGAPAHFIEPPIWEMGHVGWFQERWVLRRPGEAVHSLLPGSDSVYDAFNVSYRRRWDHAFPSRRETLEYITEVLKRSAGRLASHERTAEEAYFCTLAILHEDMHTENLTLIRQTLGYGLPPLSLIETARANAPVDESYVPHDVVVPGGTFMLGASPTEPFVFDNEKWAHPVEVAGFRIASTPVTNAQFQAFVDDHGYLRRQVWSRRGWDWRRRERVEHPLFWVRGDGCWYERRFGVVSALQAWHPVVHVNWYEAQAYCCWAGRRLPTEAEWEMAATLEPTTGHRRRFPWGDEAPTPERASLDFQAASTIDVRALPAGDSPVGCRQMVGNVWEWVEDTFAPYPGFVCDPYAEYSRPYFGDKKVLKGGAWTTRSRLIRSTWRNFYKRHRRNIFAGFRTVAR